MLGRGATLDLFLFREALLELIGLGRRGNQVDNLFHDGLIGRGVSRSTWLRHVFLATTTTSSHESLGAGRSLGGNARGT